MLSSSRFSEALPGAPLRWGRYGERTRWFAGAARSPWRGVVIRSLTCVKDACSHCAPHIEKCSQVLSDLYLSRQPLSPKEICVCHELSSVSCYTVAERFGLILDNGNRAALGAAQAGDGATGCSGECLNAGTSGQGGSGTTSQRGSW